MDAQLDMNCPCGSAKRFAECHGLSPVAIDQPPTPPPVFVQPPVVLRLDLAAGQSVREGFEGVDIWPGSKHVVDLMKYPWPWDDGSVHELHSSHFIEHIPMVYVDDFGNEVPMGTPGARDALFRFFDECYRVLEPDGWLTVICPNARNNRAFQDPTHRRFIVAETFLYLMAEWRKVNRLDHYNVNCNFSVNCQPHSGLAQIQHMHQEAAQHFMNHYWNVVNDWVCKLQAHKHKQLAKATTQDPT